MNGLISGVNAALHLCPENYSDLLGVFFIQRGVREGFPVQKGHLCRFPLLLGSHGWNMREVLHIVVHHSRPPVWFEAGTSAVALADKWCGLYSDRWWDDAPWCGCLREPPSSQVMVVLWWLLCWVVFSMVFFFFFFLRPPHNPRNLSNNLETNIFLKIYFCSV